MWPALQTGDLLFGRPLRGGERPKPGCVLIAEVGGRLVAHRLERVAGSRRRPRFYLAGDLSGPDGAVSAARVKAVVAVLFRPGVGFFDMPPLQPAGPLGRLVLRRIARVLDWGRRRRWQTRHPLLS